MKIFDIEVQWFHVGFVPAIYEWLILPILGGLLRWSPFFSFTTIIVGIAFTAGAIFCSKSEFEYKYKSPSVAFDQGTHSFSGNFSQVGGTEMIAFYLGGYNAEGISEDAIDEGILIVPKSHCETRGKKVVIVHTKTKLLSSNYLPLEVREWLESKGLESASIYYGTQTYGSLTPQSLDLEKEAEEAHALACVLADLLKGKLGVLEDFRARADRISMIKVLPEEIKRQWEKLISSKEELVKK